MNGISIIINIIVNVTTATTIIKEDMSLWSFLVFSGTTAEFGRP